METPEKDYINYSSMLGITDSYSDEKLDKIITEYTQEQRKYTGLHNSIQTKCDFFTRNVIGLERMKLERQRIKIAKEFVLKPDHIKLLDKMWFSVNQNNVLIGKLPTEDVICDTLGITSFNRDGGYFDKDKMRVNLIIEELQYAIKEIISNTLNKM